MCSQEPLCWPCYRPAAAWFSATGPCLRKARGGRMPAWARMPCPAPVELRPAPPGTTAWAMASLTALALTAPRTVRTSPAGSPSWRKRSTTRLRPGRGRRFRTARRWFASRTGTRWWPTRRHGVRTPGFLTIRALGTSRNTIIPTGRSGGRCSAAGPAPLLRGILRKALSWSLPTAPRSFVTIRT